jgi:hypothetical protein
MDAPAEFGQGASASKVIHCQHWGIKLEMAHIFHDLSKLSVTAGIAYSSPIVNINDMRWRFKAT